jgi:ABC-type transport system involved in cytochrome c biogenesis permease component
MRWLLVKDLQILRRSPLVSALLVIYPIAIAVLIGFALSRGPERPRVAFVNKIPPGSPLVLGGTHFKLSGARNELCSRIDCVPVSSTAEARSRVESGDVLAALILPKDLVSNLESLAGLNPAQPSVRVLVNEEDPVKARLVSDRIDSLVTDANLKVSRKVVQAAAGYIGLIVRGGELNFLGQAFDVLGLSKAAQILGELAVRLPPGSSLQPAVSRVLRFATLARRNLNLAKPLLGSIAHPIVVHKSVVSGSPPSLDNFAISVAATLTLMFVTVLLVAGSLALEREENAFPRLTRGLIGRTALLGEKVLLGVVASLVVTLLMLAGLSLFVSIDWGRILAIGAAILIGGCAFAAFGAAIGALAGEVRASSLLAFMVSLPIAFVSLVPSGTVSAGLFHVIEVVRGIFPFHPALDALAGGLDASAGGLGLALLQLAGLAAGYGLIARVALRRFAA